MKSMLLPNSNIIVNNYATSIIDTSKLESILSKAIPSYMKHHYIKINIIGSKLDSFWINFKEVYLHLPINISNLGYEEALGIASTTPKIFNGDTTGEFMNCCDYWGYEVINIYANTIFNNENRREYFENKILLDILHEIAHCRFKHYNKNYKELIKTYDSNSKDHKKYHMHEMEIDARSWSLDRLNFVTGEKFRYIEYDE